jgi:hypothetical protein
MERRTGHLTAQSALGGTPFRAEPLAIVCFDVGHRVSHCAHCRGDIRKWTGVGPNTGSTPAGLWVHTDTDKAECPL